MLGIGDERFVVPIFGVVVAAELAAGIAEQRRHIGVVVVAHGAQRGDAALVVVLVVDQRIGGVITVQELLGRAAFVVFLLLGVVSFLHMHFKTYILNIIKLSKVTCFKYIFIIF